jgi:hypothetical protein
VDAAPDVTVCEAPQRAEIPPARASGATTASIDSEVRSCCGHAWRSDSVHAAQRCCGAGGRCAVTQHRGTQGLSPPAALHHGARGPVRCRCCRMRPAGVSAALVLPPAELYRARVGLLALLRRPTGRCDSRQVCECLRFWAIAQIGSATRTFLHFHSGHQGPVYMTPACSI